ncbi:MAG: EpsG family protein [Ruminococcaceae bacterium]|nr:EpsG family protein [Oscillospiraceae bacterium]
MAKDCFFLALALLCFLTGARALNIGNDTENYAFFFNKISRVGVTDSLTIEKGYQWFCLIVSKFVDTAHGFFMVVAIITYALVGRIIYKYSQNIGFSVVLLFTMFFSAYTNTIRQGIAMAIVLAAYFLLKNGKWKRALLLVILAFFFHNTAIVGLALFLYKLVPKKFFPVLSISCIFVLLGISGVMVGILKVFLVSYSGYLESARVGTGWLGIAFSFVRAFVFLIIANKAYKGKKEERLPLAVFSCLLITTSLGFTVNIFDRIASYFLLITVVELPNALNLSKIKHKNFLMFVISAVLIAFFFVILIFRPEWNRISPYELWK